MKFISAEEFLELRKALEDIRANRCRWGYDPTPPGNSAAPNCQSSHIRSRKRYKGKKWRCDYCKQEFDKPIDMTEGLLPFNPLGKAEPSLSLAGDNQGGKDDV